MSHYSIARNATGLRTHEPARSCSIHMIEAANYDTWLICSLIRYSDVYEEHKSFELSQGSLAQGRAGRRSLLRFEHFAAWLRTPSQRSDASGKH